MTEAEWWKAKDLAAMAALVRPRRRASARVLRLYMAAFWRWQAERLDTPEERELLRGRAALVEEWAESGIRPVGVTNTVNLVFFNQNSKDGFTATVNAPGTSWGKISAAKKHLGWVMHEVFGNPFTTGRKHGGKPPRGWQFDPSWRTDTARALARQMYEARDFGAMPILADALQDAGCNNADVLNHCRGPVPSRPLSKAEPGERDGDRGEHVRGCWVLDLVLEKK